ncbi:hypothetical protein PUN28_002859 [Cardiocondyla obscurior]|uniref:Uncharacterized protein n=1 Tax=Cardiocondyla obscurior TaxID=286306 RepID=A0AAW2GWL4_9HYME
MFALARKNFEYRKFHRNAGVTAVCKSQTGGNRERALNSRRRKGGKYVTPPSAHPRFSIRMRRLNGEHEIVKRLLRDGDDDDDEDDDDGNDDDDDNDNNNNEDDNDNDDNDEGDNITNGTLICIPHRDSSPLCDHAALHSCRTIKPGHTLVMAPSCRRHAVCICVFVAYDYAQAIRESAGGREKEISAELLRDARANVKLILDRSWVTAA